MNPRIEEIKIPSDIAERFKAEQPFNSLTAVARLNVFIGPNNSGKSQLLRSLFRARYDLQISTDLAVDQKARMQVRGFSEPAQGLHLPPEVVSQAKETFTDVSLGFGPLLGGRVNHEPLKHHLSLHTALHNLAARPLSNQRSTARELRDSFTELCARHNMDANAATNIGWSVHEIRFKDANCVYVPTLRGMRLPNDQKHAYFDRTWGDYFKKSWNADLTEARKEMAGKSIVTGLDLYDTITAHLLGSLSDRIFIRDYEKFLSETFFEGQSVALIPRQDGDTLHIKIGSERERPVQEQGDGLQQLIILTLPLFQHRDVPLFLFIEEPDLFLHPGYQSVLINTILADKERDLYVFVTTHSSQFLDITLANEDCAVYRCSKDSVAGPTDEEDATFTVTNVSFGDRDILKHIGVRPSSVMYANCTIWVEGITDRLYFGRYLEILLKQRGLHFTENLHYAFVEYGGSNITHWSFLDDEGMDVERICSQLFLITDQDAGKDARHKKLSDTLKDHYWCLPVKEVENLLSPEVIEAVIREYEIEDFEMNPFTQSNYASRYLGRFIDDKVLPDKTASKRYGKLKTCYASPSGSVKDKVTFCRKAVQHIDSIESMSPAAIEIAERLCKFVVAENA